VLFFCFNAAVELVAEYVHKAMAVQNFFSYVSDIMSRQLTYCAQVIASFYLLCVILDIYRSPAYVYGGQELVSVTRASMWNLYLCLFF